SELAKLTHTVNQQTSVVIIAMTAMLKQFQSNPPPAQVKAVEEICVTCGGSGTLPGNTIANQKGKLKAITTRSGLVTEGPTIPNPPKPVNPSLSNQTNEIKNMMASLLQMNTAFTSGSGTLLGNTIANPKGELKAITTRSGLVTEGPTVPNPLKPVNPEEDECVEEMYKDPDHVKYNIKVPPPPFSVILEKLPEKLGDPRKFLIPCGFSELKCKALADLGASINLMPLSVWRKLGLPDLIPTQMTLELANHAICTPNEIARDVFVPVDFLKDLVSHKQSGNPTFLLHKEIASSEVIPEFHDSKGCSFLSDELPDIDSFNDIHPHFDDDPLSGSTTYSANSLLEEFADELTLISYPPDYDDYRTCDIEYDIREIEFLLF
nr:reverse transcriptase domain-containing protein [Tanacetum cinerariifolium]